MGKTSEAAVYRKYINSMKKKTKKMNEEKMTPAEKRKDTMLKKKYDKSDMKKSMQKQYGKEEGKKVYFATIRKQAMESVSDTTLVPLPTGPVPVGVMKQGAANFSNTVDATTSAFKKKKPPAPIKPKTTGVRTAGMKEGNILEKRRIPKYKQKFIDKQLKQTPQRTGGEKMNTSGLDTSRVDASIPIKPKKGQVMQDEYKYNVSEEGLRDWFGKSSGTTKSGRKVRGWVQVGGKYDGKPCARQPGQKSTPKCVSSSKRRSMSKSERDSAARRKRAADPNQPQKSGAAKPTNVSTDPKRKMKENYFNRNKVVDEAKIDDKLRKDAKPIKGGGLYKTGMSKKVMGDRKVKVRRDMDAFGSTSISGKEQLQRQKDHQSKRGVKTKGVINDEFVNEAKDKKGKGSGKKDACYHKVKARYDVWPSAYASGALVKCRKVGAANWGNKSKNEGFSPMQVAALEAAGMVEIKEGQKCWKGYEKKGTKMMFGKRYNNCVKKKSTKEEVEHIDEKMINVTPNAIRKKAAKSIIKKDLPKVAAGAGALAAGVAVGNKMTSTNEGVEFLKREKEKKKSKSEYLTQRDAGKLAKRKMAKKDQEKVNFLEPEETNESKTRLVKNGHTYKVVLTWRGKTYMVQMFVPSVSRPTRQEVEKEIQKLYPDAKVMSFLPRDLEPGEPTVMMGEEKRDEYGDIVGGPKISKKQKEKNLAKNEKDEKITRSEETINELSLDTLSKAARQAMSKREAARGTSEFVKRQRQTEKFTNAAVKKRRSLDATKEKLGKTFKGPDADRTPTMEQVVTEDDMKGMSVKSGHKRPTKSGAGMTQKGVEAYRRRNPGSKLKTAVTGKVKKGSKDAKRRKSYCARSAGQMKKFPKAAKDPNSRLRQARRRWKC
jgi:hypothetical protein